MATITTTTLEYIFIPDGYVRNTDNTLGRLLIYQDLGLWLGMAGSLINVPLLIIFFSSMKYLKANKLLAYLAIGDLMNCLGVMLQGLQRGNMYRTAIQSQIVPIQTYWSCAWVAFDLFGLCGALLPAITTLCMGVERLLASNFPVLYRSKFANGGTLFLAFSILYSVLTVLAAFIIAFINKDVKVRFYCGKKVAYSADYMRFVTAMNVFAYCTSLILTSICLIEVVKVLSKNKGSRENRTNLLKIKCLFVISILSTLTVSFPSFVSLASSFLGKLDAAISDPSDWMLVFKSSMNLFVYSLLNKEFRKRILRILTREKEPLVKMTITKISSNKSKPSNKSLWRLQKLKFIK